MSAALDRLQRELDAAIPALVLFALARCVMTKTSKYALRLAASSARDLVEKAGARAQSLCEAVRTVLLLVSTLLVLFSAQQDGVACVSTSPKLIATTVAVCLLRIYTENSVASSLVLVNALLSARDNSPLSPGALLLALQYTKRSRGALAVACVAMCSSLGHFALCRGRSSALTAVLSAFKIGTHVARHIFFKKWHRQSSVCKQK